MGREVFLENWGRHGEAIWDTTRLIVSHPNSNPLTIPPEIDADLTPAGRAFILMLFQRIEKLEARIEELESQLGKLNPQNSSLPPSTAHPHSRPVQNKPQSTKKRGGQPGHPKQMRALVPSEDCEQVIPLRPTACRKCGRALHGCDPLPIRHQVCDTPPILPSFIQYQRHRLRFGRCVSVHGALGFLSAWGLSVV